MSWNSQGVWTPRVDRNLQFLAAGTLPLTDRGILQEKRTHLSCKEKKARDHSLDPTSALLSLAKDSFFNALVHQNLSPFCPALFFCSTLLLITPYSQLFKV